MRFAMIYKWLLLAIIIPQFMFLGGCGLQKDKLAKTWVDLEEINKEIVKSKEQIALVDSADVEGEDRDDEADEPKIKDLTSLAGGGNPYLENLSGPEELDPEKTMQGEGVLLNFDNADIYEVVQVVAEILDLNYMVDPQVKGVVNIRSGKKIPRDQLFKVFKKLLNINGLDIRQEGFYDMIYVSKKPISDKIYDAGRIDELRDTANIIMQIVPIMHLASSEAIKLIKPYLSEQGTSYDMVDLNTIIINDYESKIVDALSVLAQLDVSPLSALKVRLVKVGKAPLFDVRDELLEILSSLKINKKGYDGVTVLTLERVNSLLMVSNNEFLLDTAEKWVDHLDKVPAQGRDNIYIYNVRNSVASELANLVNALIEGKNLTPSGSTPTETSTSSSKSKTAKPVTSTRTAAKSKTASKSKQSALRFAGEPTLIADDSRNVILIRAHSADYNRLVKLLERLDNLPRQVLIEVLVAEVTLSEGWELGIEWSMRENARMNIGNSRYTNNYISNMSQVASVDGSGNPPTDLGSAAVGFTYSLLNSAGDAIGILNTIADNNEVSILSSPQVLVLNNETATVNVGRQVPIVTSETINDSGNDTRTIQYKDTGIIMTVTPRINYNGIIILEIEQEVSDATQNTTGGLDTPEISKRNIKTKLAVKDTQTILMGGLIEKKQSFVENGVPLLMDIPILGWLFKYQSEEVRKTELMIMITPYVIESDDVLDQYIKSFKEKTKNLKDDLRVDN
ncbi:MAG: type II secretion system secretin GspD [Proteobacteria bacterium]|nr:type II secretion system secretin GspD [Pseudomonadota bacterium]MBU1709003.1 type II secretion system secretin GspD [Pseudomonadota bacterium]